MNLNITHIIRQNSIGCEQRLISHAALLLNLPVITASIENLEVYSSLLQSGTALPVGSVEYMRRAMFISNVIEPANLSYPESLFPYLHRNIKLSRISDIKSSCFLKPLTTKTFTGFVYTPGHPELLDQHDHEQFTEMEKLPINTMVWTSEITSFLCEWRYYVLNNEIIGRGRYDADGDDDAPIPDINIITSMIDSLRYIFNDRVICTLDVGVLINGITALVECNDAWAIGVYEKALDARKYLDFLSSRWIQLHEFSSSYDISLN